jgi:hypothetical protein
MWLCTSLIFSEERKDNNHSKGEMLPNLVTLNLLHTRRQDGFLFNKF